MAPNKSDIEVLEEGSVQEPTVDPALRAEAADLLLALDKMMTVGTYYQPGHVQFQVVSDQCLDIVQQCLDQRTELNIEVKAEGLKLFDQDFPAACREARRLFTLLDSLSLGVVKIKPNVTAQQLHDAVSVLQTRKNNLSGSTSYEEIQITGMPENIEALGRTLYLRTRTGGGGSVSGKEAFDPNLITQEMLLDGVDLHQSESEFLEIVTGLVKASRQNPAEHDEADFDIKNGIPGSVLKSIESVIRAMVGTNSDPLVFSHLITHAQAALEMTGDPQLVQLVFEKLRKEADCGSGPTAKLIGKSKAQKRRNGGPDFSWTFAELNEAISNIQEPYGPRENPESLDRATTLGICLQIMQTSPPGELAQGIRQTLRQVFSAPHFSGPERRATASLAVALFSGTNFKKDESYFSLVWDLLHEYRPEDVGPVWREIWRALPVRYRERAWPYTVNDILLGMTWRNPVDALALYGAVSRVSSSGNSRLMYALENLDAIHRDDLADDIFWPPAPLLFPVLHRLIGSSLSARLGPLLHDHLLRLQTHPLAVVMLEAAVEYHPGNRVIYQTILEQGVRESLTERMKELGGRILSLALLRLPPGERKEAWIPGAISWLGRLAPDNATEVLGRIVTEKKFLLIPAWPKDLRESAEAAWRHVGEKKPDQHGPDQVGAFAVEEEEADIFAPVPAPTIREETP